MKISNTKNFANEINGNYGTSHAKTSNNTSHLQFHMPHKYAHIIMHT